MGRWTRWGTIAAGSVGLLVAGALVAPGTALALPAGCAQPEPGGPVSCTYGFTGGLQTFTVPDGVTTVRVVAVGAGGGEGNLTEGAAERWCAARSPYRPGIR